MRLLNNTHSRNYSRVLCALQTVLEMEAPCPEVDIQEHEVVSKLLDRWRVNIMESEHFIEAKPGEGGEAEKEESCRD